MTVKEMREKRLKLVSDMRALVNKADAEKRKLTAEENTQWDAMDGEVESIQKDVERTEKLEARERELNSSTPPPRAGGEAGDEDAEKLAKEQREKKYGKAFNKYMRGGHEALSAEERVMLQTRFINMANGAEQRDQTITTTGGGYLIPSGFSGKLEDALKWYGGMRDVATIMKTETGNPLPWPTDNDTSNVGEIIGVNTQVAQQDFVFGQISFGAFKFSSKLIKVPIELLQDSYFDLEAFIANKLGIRIARIQNTKFTVGAGTTEPQGVTGVATSGKVGATGQTTSIIYDDLVDLEHSVDRAYRQGAKFMLHDSSLKVIKKLKDSQGRPLWLPGLTGSVQTGESNLATILGYPYVVNNDMAVMAANAKSVLFGALDKYIIRDVMGFTLLRLNERFADYGQVAFIAFARADGNLVDAGTHPVSYYANSAT